MNRLALWCASVVVASPLPAQSPADSTLARQLAIEVRQIIRARPGASNPSARDENGLMTDLLVRLQIQSRDLADALETATSLNGTARAFQWIADEHRRSGDHDALIRTIGASRDREELASSIARTYVTSDSLDLAARLVDVLLPSYPKRKLEAEIAVARAGHGDWTAFDSTSLMLFSPADRVDLLTRLGELLRRTQSSRFDSIAQLARDALAQVTDPTERDVASMWIDTRIRNRFPVGMVRVMTLNDGATIVMSPEIDTATSGPARVQALRNRAVTEARRDGNLVESLKTLADPAVVADTLSLVQGLLDVAAVVGNRPAPVDSAFFATLARAESLADRTDSVTAEVSRVRIVGLLARRDPARARVVAGRIKGSFARTRASAALTRQVMTTDVKRAINEAVLLRPSPVADTILREAVGVQVKAGAFTDAAQTRQRIAGTELRRIAGADIAIAQREAGRRSDAIRGLEQAMNELDPWTDYMFASRTVLPALIGLGRTSEVLGWARSKSDLRGAYARMAIMSALLTSGLTSRRGGA